LQTYRSKGSFYETILLAGTDKWLKYTELEPRQVDQILQAVFKHL